MLCKCIVSISQKVSNKKSYITLVEIVNSKIPKNQGRIFNATHSCTVREIDFSSILYNITINTLNTYVQFSDVAKISVAKYYNTKSKTSPVCAKKYNINMLG